MNIIKKKIHIGGMSCVNCQNKIQKGLYGSEGILQTKVSYNTGTGISILFQGLLKIIAGVFMVIMGINMLGIFHMLRHFSLRIPMLKQLCRRMEGRLRWRAKKVWAADL